MAFARPLTPSTTSPRKQQRLPLASSRPSSPTKPSSLNNATSRPSSRASTTGGATIRPSGPSSLSLRSNGSAASGLPTRSTGGGGGRLGTRSSVASSLNTSVSYQDSLAGLSSASTTTTSVRRESDIPRRKAGFGPPRPPPSTPSRTLTGAAAKPILHEGEEDDRRGHVSGVTVTPLRSRVKGTEQGQSGGEVTETEEEDRDGKQENVVVCLRCVFDCGLPSLSLCVWKTDSRRCSGPLLQRPASEIDLSDFSSRADLHLFPLGRDPLAHVCSSDSAETFRLDVERAESALGRVRFPVRLVARASAADGTFV